MTEVRKIKTLKDTNYFSEGTYKKEFRDYIENIGIANIITRTILAPLERWRIIKQTQIAFPLRPIVFKNAADYISRIPKQQGISAFWRGNTAGIWMYLFQSLIQIGFYDNLKNLSKDLTSQEQKDSILTLAAQRVVIPIITSFFTQIITYPIDTARVRISMNFVKQKKYFPFTGIRTCLKHIRAQENFAAMYKGFFISNLISLIHFNLFLAIHQTTKIEIEKDYQNYINGDIIAAISALILVHPLDTIKKIVQLDNLSSPSIFKNGRSALEYIKREGSYRSLFNGLGVSIGKSLIFLPTYFIASRLIQESKNHINF